MADEENIPPEEETEIPAVANTNQSVLVKERYEIKFDTPLPQFDTNGAQAYEVKDKINPQRELFALICDNKFPPRLSKLPYLKSIDHPHLLKLVEYSAVDYLPQKSRNMALIYRRPGGPKVNLFDNADINLKNSFERFKNLVLSIVSACESLRGYNISHRAIRLDNIFYKDASKTEIVLGDCLASFPALYQPAAYETVESLLCLPQGRGEGTPPDDIYAAGVVMLGLLLQKEPAVEISVPELLRSKLKKGSYAALLGTDKIYNQFTPLLKGMLEDNPENRWNYLQIYNYLDGKPNTFIVSETSEKSMRALTIGNEKLYTAKSVAIALLNNPDEAVTLIKNGKLLEWIKNGLENEKLHNRVEKLIRQNNESESSPFLVQQICIMLDFTLPVKAGDIFVFPGGIPKTLFYYLKTSQNLGDFYALLSGDVIRNWYQEQPSLRAPSNSNEFKVYVNRKDYGYGIDRIMYDFDDDLPCTSLLIGNDFVNSPAKVLRALDSNYSDFKNNMPYDRNIIAYLRCKMGKKIDGILTDLNSRSEILQISAIIRLYANIQNKHGPVQLPNLTQWLVSISRPIIQSYHNIKYQKYLERELGKIAKNGKIIEIHEILENDEAKQKDRLEYAEALREINSLTMERNRILNGGPKLDEEAKELALRLASIIATISMMASFIFSIIYWAVK